MRGRRKGESGLADFVALCLLIWWITGGFRPVATMNEEHLRVIVRSEVSGALEMRDKAAKFQDASSQRPSTETAASGS